MAGTAQGTNPVTITRSDWQRDVDARIGAIEAWLAATTGASAAPTSASTPAKKGKKSKKGLGKAARVALRTEAGVPATARYVCSCVNAQGARSWGATAEYAAKHAAKGHAVTDTMAK